MIYYWEKMPYLITNTVKNLINASKSIPTHRKTKYEYLILGSGFDIETTSLIYSTWISAYCYHWQFSFSNFTVGGRSLSTFSTFLDFLLSVIPENRRLLVLDANLGFEYSFCKYIFQEKGITEFFTKTKRNPLKLCIRNKIEFREVLGLFGRSLESIGNSFTKTKKLKDDLDYSKLRFSNTPLTETEQAYCENDVQVLSELGDYIFTHYYGSNMDMPLTSISELRQKIKDKMGDRYNYIVTELRENMPDEEIYFVLRNYLFKGGLCGTNSLYMDRTLENCGCADITSHYPSCMNHYLYPTGKIYSVPPYRFMSEKKPYIACITFYELQSKTSHSILSTHKALDYNPSKKVSFDTTREYVIDNGRVYYARKITYVVNDVEFRSLLQAYNWDMKKTTINWCLEIERYARLPYYVLEILNEQYLIKQDLKKRGLDKTVEYMFSKNNVNGCFGMMCTAMYLDEFMIDEITGNFIPREEEGEVYKKPYKEALKSVFLNPLWGMWITSYARSILIDCICRFPHCIIQYDTDSLYFYNKHSETEKLVKYLRDSNETIMRMNNIIFDNNKHFEDLGCWDIEEKSISHFKGLGSKRYLMRKWSKKNNCYEIESVVAGCPKGAILKQYEAKHGKVSETQLSNFFDYFHDGLVVKEKYSKKLRPVTVDRYEGQKTCQVTIEDYLGNEETITLSSATALVPNKFTLGLSDAHIRFYLTIQNEYNNSPKGISRILEDFVNDIDIIEIFE